MSVTLMLVVLCSPVALAVPGWFLLRASAS